MQHVNLNRSGKALVLLVTFMFQSVKKHLFDLLV